MKKKYIVHLTEEQRKCLCALISRGDVRAGDGRRARILLKTDVGGPAWTDARIAEALECSHQCVENVRRRFCERGLEETVGRKRFDSPPRKPILDGAGEARLTALACSTAPDGRNRWTLRLLASKVVELEIAESISYDTVRRILKKRTEAASKKAMVHPAEGKRRLCRAHGGRAGRLLPAL